MLKLTIDNECELKLSLMALSTDLDQHWLLVEAPTERCYKCYTCGLIGDFTTQWNQCELKGCNGQSFDTTTSNVYDRNGWSWSVNYAQTHCRVATRNPSIDLTKNPSKHPNIITTETLTNDPSIASNICANPTE
eukprot:26299_1